MVKEILITGGTGLVGIHLSEHLLNKGFKVRHLSRKPGKNPNIKTFIWDIEKGYIEKESINGVDTIIHLAGAGIADERWTEKRKNLIIKSRTNSIKLIYQLLKTEKHEVKHIISASGIGYYSDRGDEILTEESNPNTDFLARSCILWEKAVDEGKELNLKITKFRTGVILDKGKGALPKLAVPVKLFVGSPLGNGQQWLSWIHIEDVVRMYTFAAEHEVEGVYNMTAPNPVRNKDFVKVLAKALHKPLWAPAVPEFILKIVLGEMSAAVIGSTYANADKIKNIGFEFKYPELKPALQNLYGK